MYEHYNGLRCPLLMVRSEDGIIKANFNNPTDGEDDFYYKVQISGFFSPRQIEDRISVPAHQTRSVSLTVTRDDIDLQFFIFAKIVISPNATRPTREADCGIMVLKNPGFTGNQLFTGALVLSLLGIVCGFILWRRFSMELNSNVHRVMQTLGIIVLLAMLAGLIGWWFAGMLLIVLALLLFLALVRFRMPKV